MMCCWQIPKLFAAVIGGSPALTGGDLVATAAVVGGAALAVGGAAVAGAGALAGGGGSAAAGTGSAASAGGAGSSTTTAVASVGSVGPGSSAGGGSVSPPSSPSPGSTANGGGTRRQPDPPSNGSGEGVALPIRQSPRSQARGNTCAQRERVERKHSHAGASIFFVSVVVDWRGAAGGFWVRDANRFSAASRRRRSARAREPGTEDRFLSSPSTVRGGTSSELLPAVPWKQAAPSELAQSRQFWGRVGCCIRGKRQSRKSSTAPNGERKERAHSRCRSGEGFSASTRIVTLGRGAPCHPATNSNRSRGVTGGHHESSPQTRSTQSRSLRCA